MKPLSLTSDIIRQTYNPTIAVAAADDDADGDTTADSVTVMLSLSAVTCVDV